MKVEKINNVFRKFAEWQIGNRAVLLTAVFLFVLIGLTGLPRVSMVNDQEQWFGDTDHIEVATQKFEDQFGNNQNIGVLVEAKDVFDPRVLRMIKKLGAELVEKVPYADEIISLTNVEISVGTKDGMKIINPFENGIPDDPKKIEEIRKLFLSRKALADKIVTTDSKETWISLALLAYPEHDEWTKETNKDPMFQTGEVAIEVITDPKWESDLYTLKAAGMPYTETEERDVMQAITQNSFLLVLATMVILLAFFLRSFFGVIVPALTGVLGIFVVFGYMGWLGIGINANMVMLPMVLGLALSVAYSVHLVNSFRRAYRKVHVRKEAAILSIEETGWPLFFTVVTTIGSVVSFISAGIIFISWTGLTSGAVVFTNWLLVMLLIPILLSFGKDQSKEEKPEEMLHITFLERQMRSLGEFIIHRKKSLFAIFILLTVFIVPGIFKVEVNIDSFKMMGLKIPYVKRVYEITQSQLGSYLSYNVTVSYDKPDAIKDPKVMKSFEGLSDLVSKFELTKKNHGNSAVFSILDILKEMNQTLHSDDPSYHEVPDSQDMIAQLLFLYEISGGTKLFRWIDEDYSMLRLQVQMHNYNANKIVQELKEIDEYTKKNMPNAKVSIIGSAVQLAELNERVVMGEIKSIAVALVFISLLMIFVFASFKTGLIGMIPNVAPMIVIGSYMGYFNSSLDMMTMTIIPMLLGIAVDDTIHFINHIKYEFEKSGNYKQAIIKSFQDIGTTLAMTTTILALSFGMFMFAPMATMARLGFLASMGLIVALITDYVIAPILILYTKPFGKEKANE